MSHFVLLITVAYHTLF